MPLTIWFEKGIRYVADDHADQMALLGVHAAGERGGLVAGVLDGFANPFLRVLRHAVGLAVEVERDGGLGRAGHLGDVVDGDAFLCRRLARHWGSCGDERDGFFS